MDVNALAAAHPRAVISHEWLTVPGGSEKVVLAILELLPHAELIASVYDPAPWPKALTARPVHPTFVDRIPKARTQYPKLLPLMDAGFRRMDVSEYDLVVSSNHACGKNVRTYDGPKRVLHVCYCHTPMRYAWEPEFLDGEGLGRAARTAFRALLPKLRRDDLRGSRQVDQFVANSTVVADRIARYYDRDSVVVHPPVDVGRFLDRPRTVTADAPYLFFGRVVPYKRADLAVEACRRLGRPLIIAGGGRDLERVKALAGPEVSFRGEVSDAEVAELFATSRALLFPGEEDFGIVPVEAQAAGLPVIGNADGGVRDSVDDGVSGVLYTPGADHASALTAAIERFEGLELKDAAVRDNARPFAPECFAERFAAVLAAATLRD